MPGSRRDYLSFLLQGNPEEVESALCRLFDNGCLGAWEVSPSALNEEPLSRLSLTSQQAYFPPGTHPDILHRVLGRDFPSLRYGVAEPVAQADWMASGKAQFTGFALGKRFYICPSWELPPETERIVLRIDPERAFGTGSHDTTRLCLEMLEDLARPGMSAIDAGCGTAILAMAAACLGCWPVVAVESDREAATCAEVNLGRNHLDKRVHLEVSSIDRANPRPSHLVMANLNHAILSREQRRLARWVHPGGYLILSGLLIEQVDSLVTVLPVDCHLAQTRTAGEWAAVLVERNSHA